MKIADGSLVMSETISGTFDSRRNAELAIEHLVQEFGVERSDIFVTAQGAENTAGVAVDGSDRESAAPSPDAREDGAHAGGVLVSVDVNQDGLAERIRDAFAEFHATNMSEQ